MSGEDKKGKKRARVCPSCTGQSSTAILGFGVKMRKIRKGYKEKMCETCFERRQQHDLEEKHKQQAAFEEAASEQAASEQAASENGGGGVGGSAAASAAASGTGGRVKRKAAFRRVKLKAAFRTSSPGKWNAYFKHPSK